MNYAIETLKKERCLIHRCLSEWETKEYPIAKALREKRLKDLDLAISLLQGTKARSNFINSMTQ